MAAKRAQHDEDVAMTSASGAYTLSWEQVDRIRGCLLGQCVGDALGTTYEFLKKKDVHLPSLDQWKVTGGGHFRVAVGQVTDDSELALGCARTLVKDRGVFQIAHQAQTFIRWHQSKPFDEGQATEAAVTDAKTWLDVLRNAQQYNRNSMSNGALMRISPLAITTWRLNKTSPTQTTQGCAAVFPGWQKQVADAVHMTHVHPEILLACCVYVEAIHGALDGRTKAEIFMQALESAAPSRRLHTALVQASQGEPLRDVEIDPMFGDPNVPLKLDGGPQGYYLVAMYLTFRAFLHEGSFAEAMASIIGEGGDTDTNAAIAGALCGAFGGLHGQGTHQGGIPGQWVNAVLTCRNDQGEQIRLPVYPEVAQHDLVELADRLAGVSPWMML